MTGSAQLVVGDETERDTEIVIKPFKGLELFLLLTFSCLLRYAGP